MQSIEARLAALEGQLRFQRTIIAVLLIALVALVGYGAAEGVPGVINARKFVVVNQNGQDIIVAGADGKGNGRLGIKNRKGVEVVFAGPLKTIRGMRKSDGLLLMYDPNGFGYVGAFSPKGLHRFGSW